MDMWLLILTFYGAEPGPTPPKVEMAQVTEAQCKALVDNMQDAPKEPGLFKRRAFVSVTCVSNGGEVYKNW